MPLNLTEWLKWQISYDVYFNKNITKSIDQIILISAEQGVGQRPQTKQAAPACILKAGASPWRPGAGPLSNTPCSLGHVPQPHLSVR